MRRSTFRITGPLASAIPLAFLLAGCQGDPPLGPETTPGIQTATSAKLGQITIALHMRPQVPDDVSFATTGRKLKDFRLDDDPSSGMPNTRTFTNLRPGTYSVEQLDTPDGPLVHILCTSSGTDDNVIDLPARMATIGLEAGEAVVCAFVDGWENGDLVTFGQGDWGNTSGSAASLLTNRFNAVYSSGLHVGILGSSGFSMSFSNFAAVTAYLPATGAPGPLTGDLVNPTTSASGSFGGNTVALKLNVDFSDADLLGGTADIAFGDLLICGAAPLADMSVRDFLAVANTALGGGSTGYAISALDAIEPQLNGSFFEGTPITFAQDHLFAGACP